MKQFKFGLMIAAFVLFCLVLIVTNYVVPQATMPLGGAFVLVTTLVLIFQKREYYQQILGVIILVQVFVGGCYLSVTGFPQASWGFELVFAQVLALLLAGYVLSQQ